MGVIVTAGVYFIFGLIVGVFLMSFAIGCIFYRYCEFKDSRSKQAIDDLYVIGKKIHEIRNKR